MWLELLFVIYIKRKSSQGKDTNIISFIQHELQEIGSFIGYHSTQQNCIKNWINVSRLIVQQIMRGLDFVGVK